MQTFFVTGVYAPMNIGSSSITTVRLPVCVQKTGAAAPLRVRDVLVAQWHTVRLKENIIGRPGSVV